MSIKGNWRRHGSEVVIGWCQRFFSRRFATLLRRFAAQCSVAPNEKKTSGTQGSFPESVVENSLYCRLSIELSPSQCCGWSVDGVQHHVSEVLHIAFLAHHKAVSCTVGKKIPSVIRNF